MKYNLFIVVSIMLTQFNTVYSYGGHLKPRADTIECPCTQISACRNEIGLPLEHQEYFKREFHKAILGQDSTYNDSQHNVSKYVTCYVPPSNGALNFRSGFSILEYYIPEKEKKKKPGLHKVYISKKCKQFWSCSMLYVVKRYLIFGGL